jgi:hypothetical protein
MKRHIATTKGSYIVEMTAKVAVVHKMYLGQMVMALVIIHCPIAEKPVGHVQVVISRFSTGRNRKKPRCKKHSGFFCALLKARWAAFLFNFSYICGI